MDGFSVSAGALSAAAVASSAVGDGVRAARPGSPVAALAEALPGGVTAAAAPGLAERLAAGAADIADGMVRNAGALAAAAIAYRAVDAVAAEAIGLLGLSSCRPG